MTQSISDSGFIKSLTQDQICILEICKKYGCNKQKILDNYAGEIKSSGFSLTRDAFTKRISRMLVRYNGYISKQHAGENTSKASISEYDHEIVNDVTENENRYLRKQVSGLRAENDRLRVNSYIASEIASELKAEIHNVSFDTFSINITKMNTGDHHLVMPIADVHYGEVIDPLAINNINAYNPEISKERHVKLFTKALEMAKEHDCGILDIPVLGDIFSGNIHDELVETNAGPITRMMIDYFKFFVGAIKSISKNFKHVNLYCVVGNHSRTTKKWQSKNKGYNNYEYILYCFIKEAFDASETVSVTVSDSPVLFANIGDQTWKIEHGDAYKGGAAFCSPLGTVARDNFKDFMIYSATGKVADVCIMGHWHIGGEWFLAGKNIPIIFQPSIVGPGEYSMATLHSAYPAASYLFVTDGKQITNQTLFKL